ncbi:glycosyltransferase family 2 protein [Mycobacterium sp. Aquia_213]|uniref:glycosyltransferase family 2 protein n=1 Tax=Mycobacterium sp. Aquia_213 TaxID=2991728 RepID=UPI00226E7E2E|nr:glycosyltransferase family 2 protein [Mycobacterium sp. Aquia_213]WAC92044.1 glycosyltransferase family 2 protein [Mycobacterium sp. Aquia_213]
MTSVSAICPTYQRHAQLRQMIGYFRAQTFNGPLQLLILDDSPEPDESLATDEYRSDGIHYIHRPGDRMSIGAKLNALMELARGDVLMRFDDDDYYSPAYVERMLALLGDDDYLTLSGWFAHSPIHGRFCYWESEVLWPVHFVLSPHDPFLPVSTSGLPPESSYVQATGYGFASAWRRTVADAVRFPDRDHGEDAQFFDGAVNAGFRARYVADTEGLALHIVHHTNISRAFPQYVLPEFMLGHYFPGYIPLAADSGLADVSSAESH